jgi:hypothetical protein
MIRQTLQAALCIALSPLLVAQQIGQAEESASGTAPAETLFAYRSSMNLTDFAHIFGPVYELSRVPFEVPVKLTPVDPAAWANAAIGSTLTFRVLQDVTVEHHHSKYADAHAGDLIEAKVIRMCEGKSRSRQGKAVPLVKEVLVERSIKLEMEGSPRSHVRLSSISKNLIVWPTKAICMVVLFPVEYVLLLITCTLGGCDL